ncbi:lipase (class 2) domain-containing protein [Ditylenchus destructor]|nr:lipase (class 2) domain-containing protein [Ditylenchus destructor]
MDSDWTLMLGKILINSRYSRKYRSTKASCSINNYPVIFIHGNSDGALSTNSDVTGPSLSDDGWSASIAEFLQNGYKSAELYAITYGDRQLKNALYKTTDCETVIHLRRFVEAVLAYTNSSYVHIISHSMGVSFARRLIKGGNLMELGKKSVTKFKTKNLMSVISENQSVTKFTLLLALQVLIMGCAFVRTSKWQERYPLAGKRMTSGLVRVMQSTICLTSVAYQCLTKL